MLPASLLCTGEVTVKTKGPQAIAKPLRCKMWTCPHCRETNRKRVIALAVRAKPNAFLTLTVSSKQYPDADEAAQALKHGLRLLRLRLQRHSRLENFNFLAVFERHKSGHPHLHLMIRGRFIPWKLLRKWWEEITGSTHIDIRKIDTRGKAAFYVAKYIGKDLSPFAHCKRWWRSHGYSELDDDPYQPDRTWSNPTRFRVEFHRVGLAARLLGWQVERLKPEGIQWTAPPGSPLGHDAVIATAAGTTRAANVQTGWISR